MRRKTALLALIAGAALISACGGSSGGGGVTVVNGGIAAFLIVGPGGLDTVSVLLGNQSQLSGAAYDASLDQLALVGDTVWTSRDTSIARVSTHGLVTTSAVGNVWVIGAFTPKSSTTTATYSDSVLVKVIGPS